MKKMIAWFMVLAVGVFIVGCSGDADKPIKKDGAKPADAKPADAKPADPK